MKALTIRTPKSEVIPNIWTVRNIHRRFYTPTPSSRARLARLLRKMYRVRCNTHTLFFVPHIGPLDVDPWQCGYDDYMYDGIESELPCNCDACLAAYYDGKDRAIGEMMEEQ